jgi:FkbM family methyltransferase
VRESNSRFYDVCLGWKGLLVEPHPKNYERTVQLRPNAHHLNVAPSCMGNATGTVSFPEHMYTSAQVNETGSTLEIHCGPLQHYLDSLSIHHIDFWSLDVEGEELHVLQTVDFEKTQIDVIIAESDNRLRHTPEFQQKVKDVRVFLQDRGYLMLSSITVYKSDVFLNKKACVLHSNIKECNEQAANLQPQSQIQPQSSNEVVTAVERISSEGAVVCDSTPCQGIFAYSGPNKDTSSVDTMTKAIASYNYGPEANSETENKMIFMPTKTDPLSCVEEWKSSRSSWVDR